MLGRKGGRRDRVGAAVAFFGRGPVAGALADDAEIIERVGELGMSRPELSLLQLHRPLEVLRRRAKIPGPCGLFGSFDDGLQIARIGHADSARRPKERWEALSGLEYRTSAAPLRVYRARSDSVPAHFSSLSSGQQFTMRSFGMPASLAWTIAVSA